MRSLLNKPKKHCLNARPTFDPAGRGTASLCRRAAAVAAKLKIEWAADWRDLQVARVNLGERRRLATRAELRNGFPAFISSLFWHVSLKDSIVRASLEKIADRCGITVARASRYLAHAEAAGWCDVTRVYDRKERFRSISISLTTHAWALVGLAAEALKAQQARNAALSEQQERRELSLRATERRLQILSAERAAKAEKRKERRAAAAVGAVTVAAKRVVSTAVTAASRTARVIELLAAGVDQREAARIVAAEIPI